MPKNLPIAKPQAILFDWDGTLVDSFQWLLALHNRVRMRMGQAPWNDQEYRFYMHYSSRDLYPVIFGDDAPKAMEVLQDELRSDQKDGMAPIPYAVELLDLLNNSGVKLGIVSNKSHAGLNRDVDYYEWRKYFLGVVGAGRALRDKPAPDPAMLCLHEMGFMPNELSDAQNIWFVGDTDTDVECAEAAGFYTIVVGARPRDPKLGVRFGDLKEMAQALSSWNWIKD
jgi:phosphoglycolate phosphatase